MAARRRLARPSLGVQDDNLLLYGSDDQRIAALKSMAQNGVKDLRVNAIYGKVHKDHWKAMDKLVDQARFFGIRPQMTLMADPSYDGKPVFSALAATNPNPGEMGRFAKEAATRYRGKVGRYSIGNEPNHPAFLKSKHPARDYRRQFDQGAYAVRHADPNAKVLFGELAPFQGQKFLHRALRHGSEKVDGIAIHPYVLPRNARKQSASLGNLARFTREVRRLHRHGHLSTPSGKLPPIFATEFGFQRGAGSEAHRAELMRRAMRKLRRHGIKQVVQYQVSPKMAAWDTSLPVWRLRAASR